MWLENLSGTSAARTHKAGWGLGRWGLGFLEPGSVSLRGQRVYLLKGWSP